MRWRTSWLVPQVIAAATAIPRTARTTTKTVRRRALMGRRRKLKHRDCTAARAIPQLGVSVPGPRQRPGDRQTQAAPRRTLLTCATAVEALEHELILPGREARTAVADLDATVLAGDRHLATRRRVVQRVLDQHVQCSVEVGARAPRGRPRDRRPPQARSDVPRRSHASARRSVAPHRCTSICSPCSSRSSARLRTSSSSTIAARRSTSAVPASSSAATPPRHPAARGLLQTKPQSGQRRAQLMGGVGDEFALGADQPLDAVGHLVEGGAQRALLGASLDHGARRQVAAGESPGGALQASERERDLSRDHTACEQAEQQHGAGDECRAWPRCCARRAAPQRRSG